MVPIPTRLLTFQRITTTMTSNSKSDSYALAQTILAGIDKHLSGSASLLIGGQPYTPATLKAVYQAFIAAVTATAPLKGQWHQAVIAEQAALSVMQTATKGLKTYLVSNYGTGAVSVFTDFGLSAPKPTGKTTAKTKADAVELRLQTRKARHTMGKKQKADIHGSEVAADTATVPAVATAAPAQGGSAQASAPSAPAAAVTPTK